MNPKEHARVLGFILGVAHTILGCTLQEVYTVEQGGAVVLVRWTLLPVDARRTIKN